MSAFVPQVPYTPPDRPFVQAQWIAPQHQMLPPFGTPLFRKEFTLSGPIRRATMRIVGLGDYDLWINGHRVTPTGINQPWSQYEKTLYWNEHDVTEHLKEGANCVGVVLGASFWHNPNPPQGRYNKDGPQRNADEPFLLCAELEVSGQDGSTVRVGTDESWQCRPGPIVFSHMFAGEDYDARAEVKGWSTPGLDTASWQVVRVVPGPTSELRKREFPGIAGFETYAPAELRTVEDGVIVVVFPQNMSAQLRVRLRGGKAGDTVHLRCGEHRNNEGRLFGHYVVDSHITTDGQPLDYRWTFFYVGMQYAEIRGAVLPDAPNPDNRPVLEGIELVHVRCGLPQTGSFKTSSDLYNRIHDIVDWAMRSNMFWVMTDCPHREKLGWLEQAYLMAPSFLYRYDARTWFEKIMRDMRDAQEPSGMVRTVAPSYPAGRFPGAFDWTVEWGAAAVLTPWHFYEWTGDLDVLRASLDSMRRFTDYVGTLAQEGIAPGGLGDWYDYGHGQPPGPSRYTPTDLSATATWALCARTVAMAARALGDEATALRYENLHREIGEAFRKRFQDPQTRLLRHLGSPQCANAMAIWAGVVPAEDHDLLIADIVADLEKRDWQQTAGDIGHVYLIRALAEAGRSDVLHRVYSRTGTGSYGGIVAKGLTSMPETWDAMEDGYQSLNHCMLGHVMEWFYRYVAGVRQAVGSVGWRKAIIGPHPGSLDSCEASVTTPLGVISVNWRRTEGRFVLEVSIPEGMEATAVLPSGKEVPLRSGQNRVEE